MRQQLLDLRDAMAKARVDAYLVPTADFHGSEYVGDHFKGRAYVSGFTGSAGTLLVTRNWAGLWTDGRYFLQGASQLSGTGIELMKSGESGTPTLEAWLKEHLPAGKTLGFDGRVVSAAEGLRLEAALSDITIRADLDLLDEIWTTRPPLSAQPVWELSPEYAGKSREEKLADLRAAMAQRHGQYYLLASLDDIAWLLNIRGGDVACCPVVLAYLAVTENRALLFTNSDVYPQKIRDALETAGVAFRPYDSVYSYMSAIPAGETLLLKEDKVNFSLLRKVKASVTVKNLRLDLTELPKACKSGAEVEGERVAHIKDGVALTRFMKWIKDHAGLEPITEITAAEKLEGFRREQEGYLGPSFDPIMAYGAHGAIVHYSATKKTDAPIGAESFLLADTGGHYAEGSTDVTRTYALGQVTEEMKRLYTAVLRGNLHLAAAKFIRGCTGANLDVLAREPLWAMGLDYNHGTGHGVGHLLSIHEGPQNIRWRSTGASPVALAPGMVCSDEPGLYLENLYGIRLENLMVCQEDSKNTFGDFLRFETLTMSPFDLDAVEPEYMTREELRVLNDYHALVCRTLLPFFDGDEADWLRFATRPIL